MSENQTPQAPAPQATPVATSPASVPPTETAGVEKSTVKHNGNDIILHRVSTKSKAGKPQIAYWAAQSEDYTVTRKAMEGGKEIDQYDAEASLLKLANILGITRAIGYIIYKWNTNLKACQLEAGNDTLTMGEKLAAATSYIQADFGDNSKVGGNGAVKAENNALKSQLATMQATMMEVMAINMKLGNPATTVDERVNLTAKLEKLVAGLAAK